MLQTEPSATLSSPFTLTRVNPWPFRLLSTEATTPYSDCFRHVVQLDDEFERLRMMLDEAAQARIAHTRDSDARSALIRSRRRVREGKIRDEVRDIDDRLGQSILQNRQQSARLHDRIEALHDVALEAETRELLSWAADPDVQKSLCMTSTSLARSVMRFAETGVLDKPARRSLPAFVRYHSRSVARVSPFSRYTAVRAEFDGDVSADLTSDDLVCVSAVSTSRLIYRLLFRVILMHERARSAVTWRRSDLIERSVGGGLRVHRRLAIGMLDSRFEGVAEQTAAVESSSPWAALIDELVDLGAHGETLHDICVRVAQNASCGLEQARAVVEKLCELGVLVACPPAAEVSAQFFDQWRVFLVSLFGAEHGLIALHDATERARIALPECDAVQRVSTIEHLHDEWTRVLQPVLGAGHSVTSDLFLEDAYIDSDPHVEYSHRPNWEADVRALSPLLWASDNHLIFAQVVDAAFVEHYGESGTCTNLLALADAVAARVESWLARESERPGIHSFEPELPPGMRAARESARQLLARCTRPTDDVFVELPEEDLQQLASSLVGSVGARRGASLAVHGQPDGETLVVNHFYGGPGVYLSRFTAGLTPSQFGRFRSYVAQSVSPDEHGLQLSPVFGFNANLVPHLLDGELRTPNELDHESGRALGMADLSVERRDGGLVLVETVGRRVFDLRYFGFLVPFVLPSLERMLTGYWGGPAVSLNHLDDALLERLRSSTTGVVCAPELRYRSLVISRRRWAVRKADLLGLLTLPQKAFVELNTWRVRLGIPDVVFLKSLHANTGVLAAELRAAKPVLLDFHSHLHVSTLRKRLQRFSDSVVLEELRPNPQTSGLLTKRGRHATELYFDVDYAAAADDAKATARERAAEHSRAAEHEIEAERAIAAAVATGGAR